MSCEASDRLSRRSSRALPDILLRPLGRVPYLPTLQAMRAFTAQRTPEQPDEIWLLEHDPVFTQGLAGKAAHVLEAGDIPVIQTERGGQVTYHGPGQLVAYTLVDLSRLGLGVRDMVCRLEAAAIEACAWWGVPVMRKTGAPGLYLRDRARDADTPGAKIASLGLKISRGCSYHGIALNVDMDLSPFGRIHPCGYAGLPVTDLRRAGAQPVPSLHEAGQAFGALLADHLHRPT
jgi:lipoyl(octanoyl) transferase